MGQGGALMFDGNRFQYNPVPPKRRAHRACRFCKCGPEEFGEEVCKQCGELFAKKSDNQQTCGPECKTAFFKARYEKRLKNIAANGGPAYYPPEFRRYRHQLMKFIGVTSWEPPK